MNALRHALRLGRLLVVLAVSLLPLIANGQVITGTIFGTVTDTSGAALPGVTITVKNNDTGQTRTVLTEPAGTYRAAALSLGEYEVRAELEGLADEAVDYAVCLFSTLGMVRGRENRRRILAHACRILNFRSDG